MKKTLLFSSLLTLTSVFGQTTNSNPFNKLSVDLNYGGNKPLNNITSGFQSKTLNMFHSDLGIRYMFNTRVGLKLNFGYDKFSDNKQNYVYDTRLSYFSIQGIANIGELLEFNSFSSKLGMLAHLGTGFGMYKDHTKTYSGIDHSVLCVAGITPIFKISEKISINVDLSFVSNFKQQRSFDFRSFTGKPGIDGKFSTISIGLSYYIGKAEKHADWSTASTFDNSKIKELENRVVNATQVLPVSENGTNPKVVKNENPNSSIVEQQITSTENTLKDSDNDGVADYLDKEPNTPAGVKVDKQGVQIKK